LILNCPKLDNGKSKKSKVYLDIFRLYSPKFIQKTQQFDEFLKCFINKIQITTFTISLRMYGTEIYNKGRRLFEMV
jgi:hypothetical protein